LGAKCGGSHQQREKRKAHINMQSIATICPAIVSLAKMAPVFNSSRISMKL